MEINFLYLDFPAFSSTFQSITPTFNITLFFCLYVLITLTFLFIVIVICVFLLPEQAKCDI